VRFFPDLLMAMEPLILTHFTLTSAIGRGLDAVRQSLLNRQSGLIPCNFPNGNMDAFIGRVEGIEESPVVDRLKEFDCRNNRLAQLGLQQDSFVEAVEDAKKRYGPNRIGLFLGTSTSGLLSTELAYRHRDPSSGNLPEDFRYLETQDNFSVAAFAQAYMGLEGPALVISTACSSSAKVFAEARRFIESGYCDAAVVGGTDTLCLTTLYGFSALQLMSSQPCRPGDQDRDGLSLGEASGYALLEKPVHVQPDDHIALMGYGESSDAYHMTSPQPDGRGMAQAMSSALSCSQLNPEHISYVNLHGTATPTNDTAEDKAVMAVFGPNIPCSSTKGWTGHTLGAAGITEAVISMICLKENFMPGSLNNRVPDPALKANIILENRSEKISFILSNSFGFGGNNCSLIFGRYS